jgi:hypothetical protein
MKMKKGPANGDMFTDEDWNDEATLTEGSYPYSKACPGRSIVLFYLNDVGILLMRPSG